MRANPVLMAIAMAVALSGCATLSDPEGSAGADLGDSQSGRLAKLASEVEERGDTGTAIALYERAATVPGAEPAAYMRLGEAYMRTGYPEQAVKAFRAVLTRKPNDGEALIGLGSALVETGDFDAGIRSLGQGAAILDTASAYNRLGVAQTLAGRLDQATAAYATALELDPGDLDVKANLALASALTGNGQEAVKLMRQVAAAPDAQPRHKRNLIVVYGLLGRSEEIRAAPPSGLTSDEVATLLAEVRSIRAMASAQEKARALGAIAG